MDSVGTATRHDASSNASGVAVEPRSAPRGSAGHQTGSEALKSAERDAPLSAAEYCLALDTVAAAVLILRLASVDRLLADLGAIEALAPVLEPTAYLRGGSRNLDHQRRLLDAVQGVLRVVDDIQRGGDRG